MNRTIALAIGIACIALGSVETTRGQSRLVSPTIASVTPRAPLPNATPQVITITGTNFLAGVSLSLRLPGGGKLNYAGPEIRERRDTSFQVSVVLAAAGAYTLTATNPDGSTSEPFVVTVPAAARPAAATPKIDRVLPDQVTKDPQPQVLKVSGEHFAVGLSVSLTDPIGTVYLLKSPAVSAITATSFDVSIVFEMTGDYALMVTNPTGASSNNVTFKVAMRAPTR